MVMVSIISLIYKSKKYADWIFESVHKYTPMLNRGEAEFFFVANDPSDEVLNHLKREGYPYYLNNNPISTEDELFSKGYGVPEYISRVYRGYNFGIEKAQGQVVVLLNSDNCLSPDWLENLLKYLDESTIVSSQLVERFHPKHGIFEGAYHQEFGNRPENFQEEDFLQFTNRLKITGIKNGGAYMPCAFYKAKALEVGLYPLGNIAGKKFNEIVEYGDQNFYRKLSKIGVSHVTALDSIVYHFKEGEMEDEISNLINDSQPVKAVDKLPNPLPLRPLAIINSGSNEYLSYDTQSWLSKELKKLSVPVKRIGILGTNWVIRKIRS